MVFHKAKQRATIKKVSVTMLVPMLTYIFFLSYWWKLTFKAGGNPESGKREEKKEKEKKRKKKYRTKREEITKKR